MVDLLLLVAVAVAVAVGVGVGVVDNWLSLPTNIPYKLQIL